MRSAAQTFLVITAAIAGALGLVSCTDKPPPVQGFVLPDGDVSRGEALFVEFGCIQCHSVRDLELPHYEGESPIQVELGGKVSRVQSYGELMTSIVNPDHVISPRNRQILIKRKSNPKQSPMPSFIDKLSVAQLLDLATFLHSRYERLERYRHPVYE